MAGFFLGALALALPLHAGAPAPEEGRVALVASKILTCSFEGEQVVDHGVVLIREGKIEAVGRVGEVEIPEGYQTIDYGDLWLSPGFVGLHSHEAGASLFSGVNDLNDTVYLANPGMRAAASVEPGNHSMEMAVAGGVTTILYIPGSGSNIGGQGVLLKTPFTTFEEKVVRNPGSMKLAQWGNPERWGPGVGMAFENWNTRNTFRRGIVYARQMERAAAGEAEELPRNISFDPWRDLVRGEMAVSTHTQVYQVVLMTLTMIREELDMPVFLDHSTIGGWLAGKLAKELGVSAIVGPRSVDALSRGFINWARNKHEGFRGNAAGYQEMGMEMIGFNTDAPIIPQEELSVQAAMGARYGMTDERMQILRGLTIVPAITAKIGDRVGSIEVGKDADILVVDGHPADPRTHMESTWVNGKLVYDAKRDGRRW
ncbi:MAG TPA: hypothetical protein ENJ09_09810 [Planctomycetes bacterium]|nr:hypothetical protein [Planctomycetota bacterium]